MVMWRCLVVAGAALARRDARRSGNLQEKVDAVASALDKGEFSVLSDVEAMRGTLDAGVDASAVAKKKTGFPAHLLAFVLGVRARAGAFDIG